MLFDGEIVKEEFFVELFRVKIIWRVFMVIFLILQCGMTIKKKISLENFTLKFTRVTLKLSERQKTIFELNHSEIKMIELFGNQRDRLYSFTNLTFILIKIYPICLMLELLIYKYAICIIVYRKYQYNSSLILYIYIFFSILNFETKTKKRHSFPEGIDIARN